MMRLIGQTIRFCLLFAVIIQSITIIPSVSASTLEKDYSIMEKASPEIPTAVQDVAIMDEIDHSEEESSEEKSEESDSFEFESLIPGHSSHFSIFWIGLEPIRIHVQLFYVRPSVPLHRPPTV